MTTALPAHQDASEYDSILAAVMETARGRWFIGEFGRRNRHAETERVLEALRRIERRVAQDVEQRELSHPDLADLAAIFALRDGDTATPAGLTADVVSDVARESGACAEAIRDQVLTARGALKALGEAGSDARLCGALDKTMRAIDQLAAGQIETEHKIEALAQIVGTIRERVRHLVDAADRRPAQSADEEPWMPIEEARPPVANDRAPVAAPAPQRLAPAMEPSALPAPPPAQPVHEPILFADEPEPPAPPPQPAPAFESGLTIAPVGPGARLRLAIADEEEALRDIAPLRPAPPRPAGAGPRTAADYDRLSYEQRHALFAS
ncbi:hypothetical protein [Terrarubrum flagellatum]|uniref:hypothetical protein n=1 Tax=Terrirubrum flagellatum TaxID=2895980 RepID=UPI0031452023